MADIPKDVMQAATECYKGLLTTCERWDDEDASNDIPAIATLILRERERCAKIASGCSCDDQFLMRDWAPITEDKSAEIKAGAQSMFDYIRSSVDK